MSIDTQMQNNADSIQSQPNEPEKQLNRTLSYNIQVLLHDYHSQYLTGFCSFLTLAGFNVVAGVGSEIDLMNYLNSNPLPDIVIINYKTTQPKTLNVAKLVRDKYPNVKIVINTQYINLSLLSELNKVGIDGFILKTEYSKTQIIEVLQAVYDGNKSL